MEENIYGDFEVTMLLMKREAEMKPFYELCKYVIDNKKSVFINAEISKSDKEEILFKLGYSNILLERK
jgi:hypothetical protein